jgi:hypothetical protein
LVTPGKHGKAWPNTAATRDEIESARNGEAKQEIDTMAAKILTEMSVGLTPEIAEALETAVAFSGIKASQYARIALVEKLCREQFLTHPGFAQIEKRKAAQNNHSEPAAA